jgi:multimeric flavodoxin WrbA
MKILAFNGSPRAKGNTSTLIEKVLEGARSKGAQTEHVRLCDIGLKGCLGCLSCRENPGKCAAKDGFSPYLEAIKSPETAGVVIGCPIYMYRITGQMKLYVDRIYSLYEGSPVGGYKSTVPPGKTYALIMSQGAPNTSQYEKSIRYLAGMTGIGLGLQEVGRIIHDNSHESPAAGNEKLLNEAYEIGRKMVK